MIEVLGRRNSANVQKVMWTLGELGLEYHRVDVGGSFGYPDDYPSPNRVVPSMRDGEITLWESNACVRHLARCYGEGSLWPKDSTQLAQVEAWTEWSRSDIATGFFPLFQMLIRGLPSTPEKIERCLKGCARSFAQLDAQLEGRAFITGNALTVADIVNGVIMFRYMTLPIERPHMPNVEGWYQRLIDRPAYQKHVMLEYGSNVQEWDAHERASAGVQ